MILSKINHFALVLLAIAIGSIAFPFIVGFLVSIPSSNSAYELGASTGWLAGYMFSFTSIIGAVLFIAYLGFKITKDAMLRNA